MKQSLFLTVLMGALSALFICGNSSKAENDQKKKESWQEFSHTFSLGLEQARYHYVEPDVYQSMPYNTYGARWMNLKGNLWGAYASYRLTWKEKLFVQPEFRILYGKHQYNRGQKNNIANKTRHQIPSVLHETRLVVGGHIPLMNKNITLSPHTGIGYRFKSDESESVRTIQGHNLGFYRKSNYVYVPLGVSAEYTLDDTWSASLKGEYDWMVKAWHYSRVSTGRSTTFKQPNGYGLKGEASISYLYNKVKFSVSPYLNYWNIRNSIRPEGRGREPYNITWESGMRLGVTF
jgi:hypothetical protein